MGWIYIIGSSDNPVKIGHTTNLEGRMTTLQIANPDQLILHWSGKCTRRLLPHVERAIHTRFAEHHRRGEWFNVSAARAQIACEAAISSFMNADYKKPKQAQDELGRISVYYDLAPNVVAAVMRYREALQASARATAKIDAAIVAQEGMGALSAFRTAVIQRRDIDSMFPRDRVAARATMEAASRALNCLARLIDHTTHQEWFDTIHGKAVRGTPTSVGAPGGVAA